jgi:hypothetical protein
MTVVTVNQPDASIVVEQAKLHMPTLQKGRGDCLCASGIFDGCLDCQPLKTALVSPEERRALRINGERKWKSLIKCRSACIPIKTNVDRCIQ